MTKAHETVEVISDCSNYIPHTAVTEIRADQVKPGMALWIPNSGSGDTWSIRMDNAHGRGIVFEVHSVKYYSTYHMVDILAFGATMLRLSALNAAEPVKIAMDPHDPQGCSTCIERHREKVAHAAEMVMAQPSEERQRLQAAIDQHIADEIARRPRASLFRRMYGW